MAMEEENLLCFRSKTLTFVCTVLIKDVMIFEEKVEDVAFSLS